MVLQTFAQKMQFFLKPNGLKKRHGELFPFPHTLSNLG